MILLKLPRFKWWLGGVTGGLASLALIKPAFWLLAEILGRSTQAEWLALTWTPITVLAITLCLTAVLSRRPKWAALVVATGIANAIVAVHFYTIAEPLLFVPPFAFVQPWLSF